MKIPGFITLFRKLVPHNSQAFLGLGILIVGLFATVGLALQSQDFRGFAAESTIACESTRNEAENILLENDPRELRNRLRQESQSRRENVDRKTQELRQLLDQYRGLWIFERGRATMLREQLRQTLEERKNGLKEQIRLSPEEALKSIKDENIKDAILEPTQDCIEELVTKEGMLQVTIVDYEDTGESEEVIKLVTDGEELYLHASDEVEKELESTNNVKVTGYVIDQDMVVEGDGAFTSTAPGVAADGFPTPFGTKRVAVILATNGVARNQVLNHFRTTVNDHFTQSSYNKMNVNVSVYGPYSVDTSCSSRAWNDSVKAAMIPAGITEDQFDNIQVVGEFNGCGWAGIAFLPGRLSAVKTNYILVGTPIHEIGHNYKAKHARFNGDEYGDAYTVMGKSINYGLFNAPAAEHIGWLTPLEIQTVTTNGTYTIEPIGSTGDGLKALKIPRANFSPLYIEYRQPVGMDENLQRVEGTTVYTGGLLHTPYTSNWGLGTELIDATPPGDIATVALQVNQTYTEPNTNIVIRVVGRTNNSLTVQVAFPGPGTPSATPTPTRIPTPTPTRVQTPTRTPTPSATRTPTPVQPAGNTVTTSGYLSDKTYISATSGWRPVQKDRSVGGNPIILNGVQYQKGLGTHSRSRIQYDINGCTRFTARVGLDDEVPYTNRNVGFEVIADGVTLYNSGPMNGSAATRSINVNLTGRSTLVLAVNDGGDTNNWDHADWANAYITCGGTGGPPQAATPTPTTPPVVSSGPDLAVTSFELTDSQGNVKTTFDVNEPIFVKVVFENIGDVRAHTRNEHTYSVYHRNQPSFITRYAQPSDPRNFYMDNGEYPANWKKEYGSYSSHPNSFVYRGVRSWTMSEPGTYTARVFFDYDNQVSEQNEANNQRTKVYKVINQDETVNELIKILQGLL